MEQVTMTAIIDRLASELPARYCPDTFRASYEDARLNGADVQAAIKGAYEAADTMPAKASPLKRLVDWLLITA